MKMKNYNLWILASAMVTSFQASAQFDVATFMKSGKDDANKLINGYMKPMFDGFGASMNNGWYNTGKVHGIGGFDVTATINFVSIKDEMKTFDASAIGLNTDPSKPRLIPAPGSVLGSSPTIYGSKDANGVVLQMWQRMAKPAPLVGDTDIMASEFNMPSGTGAPVGIGLPNAQLAVGIGFGTEIMIRFMPTMSTGDFKVNMFGFGAKHSVSQWIFKGIDNPPIDLSAFFGYNKFNSEFGFGENFLPAATDSNGNQYPGALPESDYKNSQKITFSGSGLTIGAVVSKKLLFITPYLGASYSRSNVTMKMAGKYPVPFVDTEPMVGGNPNPNAGKPFILNMEDPITIESALNYMRFTAGLRIKLLILTIGGEYNIGKINTMGFNIGINLQSIKPFKL